MSQCSRWLTESGLMRLRGWARDGLDEKEIARRCGVTAGTLGKWRRRHAEIEAALQEDAELSDRRSEEALLDRARGYTVTVSRPIKCKRVEYDPATGKRVLEAEELLQGQEQVHVPGNASALMFLLKNRRPDRWGGEKKDEGEVVIVDDV